MAGDPHSALRTERLAEATGANVNFLVVRLQRGKTEIAHSLHADPRSHTLSGLQTSDFLAHLGFKIANWPFTPGGRCLVREVFDRFPLIEFAAAFEQGWGDFERAGEDFEACGVLVKQPVGWTFSGLGGAGPVGRPEFHASGDGHTSPDSRKLKESQDDVFKYVLSWISGGTDKGWAVHYGAMHPPFSSEITAAFAFLGGFDVFRECPELEFEPCRWRFFPHLGEDTWNERAYVHTESVHRFFDAHSSRFSRALQNLLAAHARLLPLGMNLLPVASSAPVGAPISSAGHTASIQGTRRSRPAAYRYDVALSFAGAQRALARELAEKLRSAGVEVFYDEFYPEHLWGKDLAAHFDRVYRKDAHFCVIFISGEYARRAWTYHELRSALARAVTERGREYILPIRIDATDLEGIPPTLGYVSIAGYSIDEIATMVQTKLQARRDDESH